MRFNSIQFDFTIYLSINISPSCPELTKPSRAIHQQQLELRGLGGSKLAAVGESNQHLQSSHRAATSSLVQISKLELQLSYPQAKNEARPRFPAIPKQSRPTLSSLLECFRPERATRQHLHNQEEASSSVEIEEHDRRLDENHQIQQGQQAHSGEETRLPSPMSHLTYTQQ